MKKWISVNLFNGDKALVNTDNINYISNYDSLASLNMGGEDEIVLNMPYKDFMTYLESQRGK